MLQFEAEVLSNRPVAPLWKELRLRWDRAAGKPEPGHFVTIRPTRGYDPLLRRPLAVASYDPEGKEGSSITILYQLRGPATRLIGDLGPAARVDLLGPLGKAFPPPQEGETPILAAGGLGLGPLLYLAHSLEAQRQTSHPDRGAAPFIVGFRNASSLPELGYPEGLVLCTDDGSAGSRGTPVDWMSHNVDHQGIRVYACGPAAMLAAIAGLAGAKGWKASLSAEQWMACGVGACMGCVLPRPEGAGYLRACVDGPVFELGDIDWEAEARRGSAAPTAPTATAAMDSVGERP